MRNFARTLGAVICAACAPALAQPVASGVFSTSAALSGTAAMCSGSAPFPAVTPMSILQPKPASATSGTPKIEQYRAGQLIATYGSFADGPGCNNPGDGSQQASPGPSAASGCGPFTRNHAWALWKTGDLFKVYPAVYTGEFQQPWIGPEYASIADFYADYGPAAVPGAAPTHQQIPTNITIQGVVINNVQPVIYLNAGASNNTLGQAPVYVDRSSGIIWDHISVQGGPAVTVGKAGLYNYGGDNLTTSNMEVSGFGPNPVMTGGGNGLFGAGQYHGTWKISHVELDHNGGTNGPTHNAYIGASAVDPSYQVMVDHVWSHDAYYGHLFKSRAQRLTMAGSYLQGGRPIAPQTQAETYLLDVPNGGTVVVRDTIFEKGASGPNSNGVSIAFLMEGRSDTRPQSFTARNNTFIATAISYDGSHQIMPMDFMYPAVVPGSTAWPADISYRVVDNVFAGYCPAGDPAHDYRGDVALVAAPGDLTATRSLIAPVMSDDVALAKRLPGYQSIIGTPSYVHQEQGVPRKTAAIGAKD